MEKIQEILRVLGRFEKAPGFSTGLGLTRARLAAASATADFDPATSTLTVRLPIVAPDHLLLRKTEMDISLSTYMAILDDVTTWALFMADSRRNRFGVSLSLSNEWAPTMQRRGVGDDDPLEVITRVQKVGANVGFLKAHVQTMQGEMICFASHVKYLPMGWLTDTMLSNWGLVSRLLDTVGSSKTEAVQEEQSFPALHTLFDSFQFDPATLRATFEPNAIHASLGGPIHGGCQGVLMELAATEAMQRRFGASSSRLHSMNVEYLSPPFGTQVELQVEILSETSMGGLLVPVRVSLYGKDGKLKSQGLLHFVVDSDQHSAAPLP